MLGLFRASPLLRVAAFTTTLLVASLPEESEVLREIFLIAKLPWNEGEDPCMLRRVRCNHENRIETLILSSLNLTWLPESVGQLGALYELQLSDNQLISIPDSMRQLQSLKTLRLNKNQLTHFPVSILGLHLEVLYLDENQLTFLPETVDQMRSLNELRLNSNELMVLPESIGNLPCLDLLDLDGNRLSELPGSIGQIQSLVSLHVRENQLTFVPESLGRLKKLLLLALGSNRLTTLPESLGDLTSLVQLKVDSNCLTSLPESIGQLGLIYLYLQHNKLTKLPESIGNLKELEVLSVGFNHLTSLPESIANLNNLKRLYVNSNQLTSVPPLQSQKLSEFRASRNQLKTLPYSFFNKSNLRVISLHHNFLEQLSGNSEGNLANLHVALLNSNRLRDPWHICRLGFSDRLRALYLHANFLKGDIPGCLDQLSSLEVLTLHRNKLTGHVPAAVTKLSNLSVLTLHGNRLHGEVPGDLASATRLAFFSAHSNRLVGPMPPLKLLKDCVNDNSFLHHHDRHETCDDVGHRAAFFATECNDPEVLLHCPKTCSACDTASARGPAFFIHDNRLSCSLPQQMTKWPTDMRSISLIGNMLGNGTHELPPWIHQHEYQPFLYRSGTKGLFMIMQAMLLAAVFGLFWFTLFTGTERHRILSANAGSDLTGQAHWFLLQMGAALSVVAAALALLYFFGATYYACGDVFSCLTVSNFSTDYYGIVAVEWALAVLWAAWIVVGVFFLRGAPAPKQLPPTGETKWRPSLEIIYSFCWLCIVAVLSFPSFAYAMVRAIPFDNTLGLSPWWLKFFNYQAALLMVLVDMFITPKVVTAFSAATGMRRSMLSMAARLATMWLAAVLSTLFLTTHCMNGWTYLWKVCDETTEEYKLFNISLGRNQILEPKEDLCSAKDGWWSDSACPRSVVAVMAPLLVSKMASRAFIQPIITLLRWQMSYAKDGQLYMCSGMMCTSRSLEHGRQTSLLVTMAEVALLWGALVPILLPAVLLATWTNMLMCRIGHGHFAVAPLMLDKTEAGMSRRYLHGSLSALVLFQNWFAWSSGMHGRWLLLLTALLYMCELMGLVPCKKRRKVAILDAAAPPTEG